MCRMCWWSCKPRATRQAERQGRWTSRTSRRYMQDYHENIWNEMKSSGASARGAQQCTCAGSVLGRPCLRQAAAVVPRAKEEEAPAHVASGLARNRACDRLSVAPVQGKRNRAKRRKRSLRSMDRKRSMFKRASLQFQLRPSQKSLLHLTENHMTTRGVEKGTSPSGRQDRPPCLNFKRRSARGRDVCLLVSFRLHLSPWRPM